MSERLAIPIAEITPGESDLLRANGVPEGVVVSDKVSALIDAALARIGELAGAEALLGELDIDAFDAVYRGAVDNAEPTPLASIYPRADRLAMFVVTMGAEISEEIAAGFGTNDFAAAAMLDTAASLAADNAVSVLEARFEARLDDPSASKVLSYSPGYCGWHISGQVPLFERLEPTTIGVRLTDSFLMRPLKSVSGVLVAASARKHAFANNFEFCELCRTKNCRERIGRLQHAAAGA